METQELMSVLESILFVSVKPLSLKDFSKLLEIEPEAARQALAELAEKKSHSGVVLLESNGYYQLATNAANAGVVKNFLNSDLREKLTDATVEVLAIIAYRQPISKAELEAIRGVNSQYSLRHLLMRGMIEKIPSPSDSRSSLYQTTTEFLQHLGITSMAELPEFEKLVASIKLPETPAMAAETADSEVDEVPQNSNVTEDTPASSTEVIQVPTMEKTSNLPEQPQPQEAAAEATAETRTEALEDSEDEFDDEDDDDEAEPSANNSTAKSQTIG